MALDEATKKYIDDRFAAFEQDAADAIALGHRIHDARPVIDRQGLEIQYGTVVAVNATEVTVVLDADQGTPVAMFTMANVAIGARIAALLVPPSSGLVLGTLGGLSGSIVIEVPAGQVDNAIDISTTDGQDLLAVTPAGAIDMVEQTLPASPAANTGRLFMVDNGAGKTSLRVIFPTGAAQTLATEL